MDGRLERYVPVAGRLMLSAIFILSGPRKTVDWDFYSGYMASQDMPAVPFFLVMAILFELTGGLMVLAGYRARLGAFLLIVFLVPTTLIFHDFWSAPVDQQQNQMIHFMKNVSILGGLLMVLGLGAGGLSFDGRRRTH
ncbi:MAG: DoxX family protein [Candidatus Hydrogenedentes bacterium]|nr:DoxX family protein [Candidatus Hydrogenedentota bacterium]